MKKAIYFFILGAAFLVSACASSFIKEPSETDLLKTDLSQNGLLIFSLTFAQNNFRERLKLSLDFASADGLTENFQFAENEDQVFIILLPQGNYWIKDLKASATVFSNLNKESSSPALKNIKCLKQWQIQVLPGKINYAGNFFIQDFSDESSKYSTQFIDPTSNTLISAEIQIRRRQADLTAFLKKHPYLSHYFPHSIENLMLPHKADFKTLSSVIHSKVQQLSNYTIDGFTWEDSLPRVRDKLLSLNRKVLIIDSLSLIDNTNPLQPVEYLFSTRPSQDKAPKTLLAKIVYHYPKNSYTKSFAILSQKNGTPASYSPVKAEWNSPYSRITLLNSEQEVLLTYEDFNLSNPH